MSATHSKSGADPQGDGHATHAKLSEYQLPGYGTFALITLANSDTRKPALFTPSSLLELAALLEGIRQRASAGELAGIGITGNGRFFLAGADLSAMRELKDEEPARRMASLGHEVFGLLNNIDTPTFAFINGSAIGGGLEIALASDYRTISAGASVIALPEAFVGLVPGWGGAYRLPRLIGPGNAVKIMVENPLTNNRTLGGPAAFELGIADVLLGPADFLEQSLAWAAKIITKDPEAVNSLADRRKEKATCTNADWDAAISKGRSVVEAKNGRRRTRSGTDTGSSRKRPAPNPDPIRGT
jgi:enoyl-CoA hydratase/carnithine racemase